MNSHNRREFLADVGRGMLVASVGSATALELGLSSAFAGSPIKGENLNKRITFGKLEPLVSLMQETPTEKLLPLLVNHLNSGTDLKTLTSAAALANVRAFAGQDYIGYHTFMALVPAYQMAMEQTGKDKALPVLKVLYRNNSRIHGKGANKKDAMHQVTPLKSIDSTLGGLLVQQAVREVDWNLAESRFATLAKGPVNESFNSLQFAVQDEVNVHRVVLSWRAFAMLDLTGKEYAHTLLRQSVRYCVDQEQRMQNKNRTPSPIRKVLPKLMDEHKLLSKPLGKRIPDDAWVEHLSKTIYSSSRQQAAEAVAIALSEGMNPNAIGEALSIAANKLVLHDPGRLEKYSKPQKPAGCVHGDSVGVHASDAANAWHNIARVSNHRNRIASLIVGAYHTAGQTGWVTEKPYPYDHLVNDIRETSGIKLINLLEESIKGKDQARACAIVKRYGDLDLPSRPIFDLLLKYAVSQDGALHAEKYYRTVVEEFSLARPVFRWQQVIALARVTASEFGFPAPGVEEARDLLGIS